MISESRLLRFMTISAPVVLVSVPLFLPHRSRLANASAALDSALRVCQRTSTVMSPHTDAVGASQG